MVSAESALHEMRAAQQAADGDEDQLRYASNKLIQKHAVLVLVLDPSLSPSFVRLPARRDFDRLVAAAVSAREDAAERRVAAALTDLATEAQRADEAEGRAMAAERAKIELTLAMARTDVSEDGEGSSSREVSVGGISRPGRDSRRHQLLASVGGGLQPHLEELVEDLQRRSEEAELAAAVQVGCAACAGGVCMHDQLRHARESDWKLLV